MIEPTIVLNSQVVGIRESPVMGVAGLKVGTLVHADASQQTQ